MIEDDKNSVVPIKTKSATITHLSSRYRKQYVDLDHIDNIIRCIVDLSLAIRQAGHSRVLLKKCSNSVNNIFLTSDFIKC